MELSKLSIKRADDPEVASLSSKNKEKRGNKIR